MHHEISFQPLLLVIILALLVPLLISQLRRVRIPIVVGELIVGIIIGHSGLNLVPDDPWINFLALFGFAYLMFLSGMEIDFNLIFSSDTSGGWQEHLRGPIGIGIIFFIVVLALSFATSLLLVQWKLISSPWIMSLILSTTSLGVVVPVLKERHLLGKVYGQTLLVSALIADFLTMLLISVYVILSSRGITPDLLTVLVLVGAFLVFYRLTAISRTWLPLQRVVDDLCHATAQIRTRAAFATALTFIVLAEVLDIEIILGAFLGGVIVSLMAGEEGSLMREKLDAIGYGFLIPIFFIMVGVSFDLPSLLSTGFGIILPLLLLVAVYLIRLVGTLVYRLRFSWGEMAGAAVLLSARLSLTIAAAEIGLRLGVIDSATNSAIILLTILTCIISPPLFNKLHPFSPEDESAVPPIAIVGGCDVARLVTESLRNQHQRIFLISDSPAELTRARQVGIEAIQANVITEEGLQSAGVEAAETVVVVTGDDGKTAQSARLLHTHFGTPNVIAHVHDPSLARALGQSGIHVVTPLAATTMTLRQMAQNPAMLAAMTCAGGRQIVRELTIHYPNWSGEKLQIVSNTLPTHCHILMITREGIPLIPTGETVLQKGDILTFIGPPEEIEQLFSTLRTGEQIPIEA